MPLVPLGAFYLDDFTLDATAAAILLLNRSPEPGDVDVPPATEIQFVVASTSTGVALVASTQVYVSIAGGPSTLVFDQTAAPQLHAAWSTSTFTAVQSPGSAVVNEHWFTLRRATPFGSLEKISVRVLASTASAQLDEAYTFTIQDLTAPQLLSVSSRGPRKLRAIFNEPLRAVGDGVLGDSLRVRDVSGGVETAILIPGSAAGTYVADAKRIRAPGGGFSSSDVGLTLEISRSAHALNNGRFTVQSVVDAQTAILDRDLVAEGPSQKIRAYLSSYELVGTVDPNRVVPVFEPLIVKAEVAALTPSEVVDGKFIVDLTLDQPLSPERGYTLNVRSVDDLKSNRATILSATFIAEPTSKPLNRSFSTLDMVPRKNLREDTSKDLERLLRVFDDALQILLVGADGLADLMDHDRAPEHTLDALLAHLGNPFVFAAGLSASEKRKLVATLVPLYKAKGTAQGIVDAIRLVLGIEVKIDAFNTPADSWMLGVSALGAPFVAGGVLNSGSVLAPGTSYLRFAFEVESPRVLVARERLIIDEIVHALRPAHTHYVRLVEPAQGGPSPQTTWILGVSQLGESTVLS